MSTTNPGNGKLAAESIAFGLGYTAVLIWTGSALVASFTGGEANPYWSVFPHLRTDTSGVIAFAVAIVTLSVSRYLQLRRGIELPVPAASPLSAGRHAVQAIAETAVVLATGMVIYLSVNAVTHPETLMLQLTHLWPWPSEGTVRVIGLGICLAGVSVSRYLRASASLPGQTVPAAENTELASSDILVTGFALGNLSNSPFLGNSRSHEP